MAFIRVNRNYNFIDKDPVCDELATLVQDRGLRGRKMINKIAQLAGVAPATVEGILYGSTRKPQNATIMRIGIGLGYERVWSDAQDFDLAKQLEIAKAHRLAENARKRKEQGKKPRKKSGVKKKRKKPHLRLVA